MEPQKSNVALADIDYDTIDSPVDKAAPAQPVKQKRPVDDIDYDSIDASPAAQAAPAQSPQATQPPTGPSIANKITSAGADYLNPPPPLPAPAAPPRPSIAQQNGNLDLAASDASKAPPTQTPQMMISPEHQAQTFNRASVAGSRAQMSHQPGEQPPEPLPSVSEALQTPIVGSLSGLVDKLLPPDQPSTYPSVYEAARTIAGGAAGIADFAQSPEGIAILAAEVLSGGAATPLITALVGGQLVGQSANEAKKALEDMRDTGSITPENSKRFLSALLIAESAFLGPAKVRDGHLKIEQLIKNKKWLDEANAAYELAWRERTARQSRADMDQFEHRTGQIQNQASRRSTLNVPETNETNVEDPTAQFSDKELDDLTKPTGQVKPTQQTAPEQSTFGIPPVRTDQPIVDAPLEQRAANFKGNAKSSIEDIDWDNIDKKPVDEINWDTIDEKPQEAISESQPKPDEALSKRVAKYYDETKSDPNDPAVQKSYEALNKETDEQFENLKKQGYTFEFTDNPETYPSSADLIKDVKENKHLRVWTGEPPTHGMMTPEQNAKFRAVHDVFGHGQPEATFGHAGEEKAYKSHYDMYSEAARPALATETRGQNSAVHFSDELGNNPADTYKDSTKVDLKFPEQKAIAMPHELRKVRPEESEGLGLASKPEESPDGVTPKGVAAQGPAFETRTTPRGTTIWMSDEGRELIRAVTHQSDATALTLKPDHVRELLSRIVNDKSKATIELRASIRQALSDNGRLKPLKFVPRPGVEPLGVIKEVMRHEGNHVSLITEAENGGYDLDGLAGRLAKNDATSAPLEKIKTALKKLGYKDTDISRELTAYLAGGQLDHLGITPDEAVTLMSAVADDVHSQLGTDKALEVLSQSHPKMKEVIDEVINRKAKRSGAVGAEPREVPSDQEARGAGSRPEVVSGGGSELATGRRPAKPGEPGDAVGLESKGKRRSSGVSQEWTDSSDLRSDRNGPYEGATGTVVKVRSDPEQWYGTVTYPGRKFANHVGADTNFDTREEAKAAVDKALKEMKVPLAERRKQQQVEYYQAERKSHGLPKITDEEARKKLGLASNESKEPRIGKKELEQVGATKRVIKPAEDFADYLEQFGVKQNVIAAAERGSVAKYWYENSKKALDKYFGDDAHLMSKLLAATSTQTDVKTNLRMAVNIYNDWVSEGRPTDEAKVGKILERDSDLGGRAFASRFNNASLVLTGADHIQDVDLSNRGPKTRSFWRNLAGQYDNVVLDRHMATLAGVAQSAFGTSSGYLGSQIPWKEAAREKGWNPAQIQSTSWSWTKPFADMIRDGMSGEEALKNAKPIDREDIEEFAKFINEDPEVRKALDAKFRQQGTTLEEFEAKYGKAQIKYGRKEKPVTPFTADFAQRAEAKIRADQAAGAEKLQQKNAKKKPIGFASKGDVGDAGDKLLAHPFAKQIRAAELNKSGFITDDGRTVQIDGDHGPVLEKAGILPDGRDINAPSRAPELAASKLIRVHVVKGFAPEIALSSYGPPTRLQISSLRNMAEANPKATFSYDFYKDGKYLSGKGAASYSDFAKAANKAYDLGLDPRLMASKSEEGVFRFGHTPNKPEISTNSPEYQKIEDGQNKNQLPGPVDLLASLKDKTRKLGREALNRWIDVKEDVVDDAVKRGVVIPAGMNPLHALQLEYGGGMGRTEAAHWDMSDVKRDANKAGLYGEVTKYLNLVGNRRAIEVVQEKLAAATARGDAAAVAKYTDKLNQAKVAAGGFDMPKLTRDLQDQEKQLGAAKWKQVQDFGKEFFKIPREALDMAHDEGITSDDLYNKFTSRGDEYVHMGRIIEDVEEGRGTGGQSMSLPKQHGIKGLEGSELINKDPWASTMKNIETMYRDIARNRAAKKLIEFRQIDPQGWGSLVRELKGDMKVGHDEGTVSYYEDGKPRTFAVPSLIADAVTAANAHEINMIGSALLGKTAKVFRAGATGLNAAYALTSPIREFIDTGTMMWRSPADAVNFTKNLFTSLGHIVKRDALYRDFLRSRAAYSSLQSQIDPYVNLHGNEGAIAKLLHPLESVGQLNDALQTMSKMAGRKMLVDKGVDPTEAAAEARVYSGRPDVANAGTRSAEMNRLLIFFVDKLKGAERSYMFMKSHPRQFIAASAALAAGELVLNRWNAGFKSPEGDGSDEWDHVSENDKRANYNVLTPYVYTTAKGEKRLLSLKIPRGRFAAGGVARDMWAGAFGQVAPKQTALNALTDVMPGDYRFRSGDTAGEDFLRATGQTVNPLIREPIEQWANEDLYSGHPIVSKGTEGLEPRYQYNESTSPTAIKLGKALDASPERIEHFLRGVGAGVSDMVVSGLDSLQKDKRAPAEGPEKASRLPVIGPIIRRFVGSSTDQVRVDDEQNFYDLLDKSHTATETLDTAFASATDRKEVTNEYLNNPEKLVMAELAPTLADYSKQFASMREMMTRVAKAQTRSDLGDLYPAWEKDPGKMSDDTKKSIIRAVHQSYKSLLEQTKEAKKAVDVADKLPKDYRASMFADILNRNRGLNPEPDSIEEEQ